MKLESLARGKDQKHSEFGFRHPKMILKIQHWMNNVVQQIVN